MKNLKQILYIFVFVEYLMVLFILLNSETIGIIMAILFSVTIGFASYLEGKWYERVFR